MHPTSRWGLATAAALLVVVLAACSSGRANSESASTTTTKPPLTPGAVAQLLEKALKEQDAGKLDEAVRDYNAVVADDPTNKFAHYNLGLIHQARKQAGAAETEYRQALSTDAEYVPALYHLGLLRSADRDIAGAIDLYREAIAGNPRYAGAHFNLGLMLIKAGRTTEGRLEIANAIKLDPALATRTP